MIMEVLLRTLYANQECVNRWNYVGSGTFEGASASFALASAFGAIPSGGVFPADTIINWLVGTLATGVDFLEIQVRDVYSTTDFFTLPFPAGTNGADEADSSPPFNAYGFRTNRVRSDVARGTKRFVGVVEPYVGDLGVLTPTAVGFLNIMATLMSEVLEYSVGDSVGQFTPAVCGKERYSPTPETQAYRYYATEAEQLAHTAQGVIWSPYNTVRSQVSRQVGHGR